MNQTKVGGGVKRTNVERKTIEVDEPSITRLHSANCT